MQKITFFLSFLITASSFADCKVFMTRILTINERDFSSEIEALHSPSTALDAAKDIIQSTSQISSKEIISDSILEIHSDTKGNVWTETYDFLEKNPKRVVGIYYLYRNGVVNTTPYQATILGRVMMESHVQPGGTINQFTYVSRALKKLAFTPELTAPLYFDLKKEVNGCYSFKGRDLKGKPVDFNFSIFFGKKTKLIIGSGATELLQFKTLDPSAIKTMSNRQSDLYDYDFLNPITFKPVMFQSF